MRIVLWFIQSVVSIVSLGFGGLSLWANYRGWDMWGLEWQIWALIGVGILVLSLGSIIGRLLYENHKLRGEDVRLTREERKLNIKNGLFDLWQKTLHYRDILPEKLRKELED